MWNQSKIGGFVTPALTRTVRRPGQPSVKAGVGPAHRFKGSLDQRGDAGFGPGDGATDLAATINRLDVADADLQVAFAVFAAAYEG